MLRIVERKIREDRYITVLYKSPWLGAGYSCLWILDGSGYISWHNAQHNQSEHCSLIDFISFVYSCMVKDRLETPLRSGMGVMGCVVENGEESSGASQTWEGERAGIFLNTLGWRKEEEAEESGVTTPWPSSTSKVWIPSSGMEVSIMMELRWCDRRRLSSGFINFRLGSETPRLNVGGRVAMSGVRIEIMGALLPSDREPFS